MAQAAYRLMAGRSGAVVNMGSGLDGEDGYAHYNALIKRRSYHAYQNHGA